MIEQLSIGQKDFVHRTQNAINPPRFRPSSGVLIPFDTLHVVFQCFTGLAAVSNRTGSHYRPSVLGKITNQKLSTIPNRRLIIANEARIKVSDQHKLSLYK